MNSVAHGRKTCQAVPLYSTEALVYRTGEPEPRFPGGVCLNFGAPAWPPVSGNLPRPVRDALRRMESL